MRGTLERMLVLAGSAGNTSRRLVVILMAAVLVAIWAAAGLSVATDRSRIINSAELEIRGAIPLLKMHARRTMETAHAILVAIDEALQEDKREFDLKRVNALAAQMQVDVEEPISVAIIDADGQIARIEENGLGLATDHRTHAESLLTAAPRSLHIGVPQINGVTGRSVIPVLMKARPNALGIGMIMAALPSREFETSYKDLLISAPSTIGLLRGDGHVLHLTPDARGRAGQKLAGYDLEEFGRLHAPLTVFEHASADVGTGLRRTSYGLVEPFPLVVFASMENRYLTEAWIQVAWPKVAGALAVSVMVLLLSVWILILMRRRDVAMEEAGRVLEQLDAANNAKRDFMARMSHELRTPMNAIIGFSELIAGAMFGPLSKTYQDYGHDIHRSGRHLLRMINQVLDITRIEAGVLKVEEAPVNLQSIADEVMMILRPLVQARQVEVRLELDPAHDRLLVDPGMMRQMLLNLVSNAVKFSPPGERVVVRSGIDNGGFTLHVMDHGVGMPPDKLKQVFEPFGSGPSMLAERSAGIGLGLPITKALVEMHGGRMSIVSAAGAGSSVTLHFPPGRRIAA